MRGVPTFVLDKKSDSLDVKSIESRQLFLSQQNYSITSLFSCQKFLCLFKNSCDKNKKGQELPPALFV